MAKARVSPCELTFTLQLAECPLCQFAKILETFQTDNSHRANVGTTCHTSVLEQCPRSGGRSRCAKAGRRPVASPPGGRGVLLGGHRSATEFAKRLKIRHASLA